MIIRLLERGRGVFFGLLLLGIATVVGGLFAARWASDRILKADAEEIAMQWTELLMEQFRNPAAAKGTDPGLHVEMISTQLLAAFQATSKGADKAASKGADKAASSKPADDASDPGAFHRGKFVSQIFRYVIFGKDGAIFAKSGRFDDVHALDISGKSAGGGAFDRAAEFGELTIQQLPEHIQRVFVPYKAGRAIPYIVAVDVDQYAAATLLSGVMNLVMVFTGLFMASGLSAPVFVAWRRTREILRAEDRLRFLALHDSLTGLPNRVQLREHLVLSMSRAERHGCLMAVLYLDLDRFKTVNDSFGHATGDALLEDVAARLKASLRETDLVGRLGGDEFVVVAEHIEAPGCAAQLADRIRETIATPLHVNGHELAVSTSIGIAIGPGDGIDADGFLKNADLALCRAKTDGRNRFRFFEEDMDAALQ
ncbi:MAG: diguanylate cyclase domain-containing protein, partial [Methyloligellaceae bacterium]